MWFYKFEQDSQTKKVRIIWNTKMTYLKNILGFGGVAACFLNLFWIAAVSLLILALLLGYYLHRYGDLIKALRIQEKADLLEYEGSRYSFKDPLVVCLPMAKVS